MDGNGCFVCGNDCSTSTLVLINLETKKYKTRYTILIGNLINSEYELRIAKSDKICEKCSVLIEKYDELQYETKTVKSVLSRQIANTYSIETDEELVYMDKSKIFCELRSNGIDDSKKYSCKVCPNFVTTCIDAVNSHIIYHKIIEEQKHSLNNTMKEVKMATTSKSRVQQTAREVPKIPEKVKSSSSVVNVVINHIQEPQEEAPIQQQHQQLSAQYSMNSGSQEIDQDTLDSLIDMTLLDDEFYDSNLKDHKCAVEYCTETFVYASDYVRHLKLKHKSNLNHIFSALKSNLKRPKKISKFMCPYCFTKTSSNEQLEMHVKQHEEIVGKPAHLSERIGDFIANLMQACRCTICDCEILDPTELECNHEIVKNGMAPKLNCIFCDCYFYNEKLYNNHLAIIHTQCFICGSAFNDKNVLNDHICSHLSHSEFACLFCKDIYQTNKNRLDHMKSKHSTNCCSYCDQWYKNTSELEHHLRFSHADKRYKEKSSICDYCGATFKNKQLYEVHLQTDHKTRKIYKCSTCKQDFRFRYLLMDHVSSAHNRTIIDNEVNFYKCCFCMKGFPSQNRKLFIEHLEKHQLNSTFCFDCNTNIESAQSLELHRERFHQDFSKTVDKPVTAENSNRHANVKLNNNGSKSQMTFVPAAINQNKIAGKNELSTQQAAKTKQRPINEVIPQQQNVQIAAPSPKQPQYEIINNLNIQQESQQQPQQIMIQNEDGSFLNNLILTENGELIIQNLDGLMPNGQESDEGTIQISNLEQFLMEQGLSSNTEISYIQPDIISDGSQVVIQNDDGTTQESLMQTYKEIFEPDDEISAELIDSSDAQQMEHQTQNILLNGEYVLQAPSSTSQQSTQQQTKASNNNNNVLQATIEHVDVGNAQVLDAANQSTLDELGDILLEVAAAAEKEKKPKGGDPNQKVMRETLWGKKRPAESFREASVKRRSTKQLEILPEAETPARNFSQAYEFFVKGFDAKKQKQL